MDRQAETASDFLGEGLHLLGLYSFAADHAEGEAHYNLAHIVFADDLFQPGKICALVLTLESFQALSRDTERVGDREPDASRTYIHPQNSFRTPCAGGIGLVGRHLAIICRSQLLR